MRVFVCMFAERQHGDEMPERMFFRLSSSSSPAYTHCGVREFTAPEGTIIVPQWVRRPPDPSCEITAELILCCVFLGICAYLSLCVWKMADDAKSGD